MRKQTMGLLVGFALYEIIAYQVNHKRIAQQGAGAKLLPLDLIGRFLGYPGQAFTPANFPGVAAPAPSPAGPSATEFPGVGMNTPIDPNNLLPLPTIN